MCLAGSIMNKIYFHRIKTYYHLVASASVRTKQFRW